MGSYVCGGMCLWFLMSCVYVYGVCDVSEVQAVSDVIVAATCCNCL